MACTAHQTRDHERNSPSRRAGCLPACSLASVLRRLERPIRSPFIESFLLRQIPSCFSAGPRIYTGLSCPAWAPVLCLFFPSVLELFSFPGQGIPDEPPNVMPAVRMPQQEEKTSMTMKHAKEGKFIADSSQGPCCNQRSGAKSERERAPVSTHIYRVLDFKHKQWVVGASRLVTCLQSNFIGTNFGMRGTFQGTFPEVFWARTD